MDFNELVLHYGVLAGRRYTEEDKLTFLSNIKKEFSKLGYQTQILKKDLKRFSGLNLYIGDVVKANNLVIAHYDTPYNSFDDNIKFYPFDTLKSNKAIADKPKMRALRVIIVGMVLMFIVMFFFKIKQPYTNILLVVSTVVMTLVGYLLMRGAPNVTNANLNTSGVLAILDLAKLKPSDTAFILTDRECIDNLGDVMVNEALPNSIDKKTVIHLKAIGNGEDIVIGFKKSNLNLARKLAKNSKAKLYELNDKAVANHALNYYPKAVSISVASGFNDNYEINNVANDKDLEIDYNKYKAVVDLVYKFLVK